MFKSKDLADGEFCPLIKDKCIRHKCAWFSRLVGMDPQTGQPVDKFGCSVSWLPILLVENSNQGRQTAASVDKVANEVAKHRNVFVHALNPEIQERILPALKNGD